ncbi:MAG: RagB/SusD family nutrient uptake outer membrane protein [Bacteroidales bacterium]|nr:RagB/SusD family nutrient uptake outer membrane protein [Bacteroidales bacterium]MDD3907585.1 RagB/SusD family nutrient uptake outer membrane protein [Bacteroidales bacterium]MDD4713440.1 RagB/SusD family nutrient uptake outer membrane protein [Bacteroidales bacterium]
MNTIKTFIHKNPLIIGCFLVFISCNDHFLDREPLDTLTNANFWQSEDHLISAANVLYEGMTGKDLLNYFEIMGESSTWAVPTAWRTIGGGNYATDISQLNSFWVSSFENISRCNYFLENYNRATSVPKKTRERYAAEAYFFRAFTYWRLTSLFGDIPYITKVLNVNDADVYRSRDKRAVVVDSITAALERSYVNLPAYIEPASKEFGRISQAAALTLLSRIYLYNERWDDAVSASKRVMDMNYHKLYSTGKPTEDYCNLFKFAGRASRVSANKETILAFVYNSDLGEDARVWHNLSREVCEINDYARWMPTKSMIEAYLTADGKIWDPKSINTYEEVFENRDPRMRQSILPPNTPWEGRKDGNPNNTDITMFTYPKLSNDKTGGMTYSGYYILKYEEPTKVNQLYQDDNDIIMMRYAEVLLNYAEARYKQGSLTQATLDSTVNLLRDRVGMVRLDLNNLPAGSDIFTEIKRERRVELFFEGHRYFDIIRWKEGWRLGEDLLGVNRNWLDPNKLEPAGILNELSWKYVDGGYYLIIESGRTFDPAKNYLLSLPFKQMQRNPNLLPNNPGWN